MSGHSKWSSIKHKKAIVDTKRGKLFTKLIREITTAARIGGGSVETNPRLRVSIGTAKDNNMPSENIDRAIKKGIGELPGVTYEEMNYEGYGPGGVAIYVESLTDNKNRTAADVRSIFNKAGGNMAGAGSVAWIFEKKGLFIIPKEESTEDALMEIVITAGAEDLKLMDDVYEVTSAVTEYDSVKNALEAAKVKCQTCTLTYLPKNLTKVDAETAQKIIDLSETFEDHDDVQNVYTNADFPDGFEPQ